MNANTQPLDYSTDKTLLGSIGEHHRLIQMLLSEKSRTLKNVQIIMDQKARNKTPLHEKQLRKFNEFTGLYAREGGLLKDSLVRIVSIHTMLHTKSAEPLWLSLLTLQKQQRNAINSLRRMIASGEQLLEMLM